MTNGYMTWLADALRDEGLPVVEVAGWKNRGHDSFGEVWGVGGHHTAGPATGDFPSLGVLIGGRADLLGPLCQLGLSRSGVFYTIAAGVGWHMGAGSYPGIPTNNANYHLIGIEPESAGTGDWTAAQLDAYPRGIAAILRYLGLREDRFIGHKEWRPSNPDPAGWPGDMDGMRDRVRRILDGEPQEEDDMFTDEDRKVAAAINWRLHALTNGYGTVQGGPDQGEAVHTADKLYEIVHDIRRLLSLAVAGEPLPTDDPGPVVVGGEEFPLVTLLRKVNAKLDVLVSRDDPA